ncbi:MAG: elongation factor Ts [Gammaproteobacteria bacterium]|nr:elongation factor Ts [Gammaproteobacteria bacterium]
MAAVTAQMVKDLRERTGAGMMDCKKALTEVNGDIEQAIDLMRKSGQAKAAKKASRVAAEGLVVICQDNESNEAAMVEINSETDFVARQEDFIAFANRVAQTAVANRTSDIKELNAAAFDDTGSVEQACQALVVKIGENIQLRRVAFMHIDAADTLASYIHFDRIGVLLEMEGGDAELGKNIAMHVAALRPQAVSAEDVPAELVEKEREIFTTQAKESGKPEAIIEKMVEGRIRKFLGEVALEGQPFVRDPSQSVGQLLKDRGAKVKRFIRFEVGEGIAKAESNFAEEVKAAVEGSDS